MRLIKEKVMPKLVKTVRNTLFRAFVKGVKTMSIRERLSLNLNTVEGKWGFIIKEQSERASG